MKMTRDLHQPEKPGLPAKQAWRAPLLMLIGLLFGMAFALGHHFFYQSLNGQDIENVRISQSWIIRLGTLFAFLVKLGLAVSVGIAFVQLQWNTMRRQAMRVKDIDSVSNLRENLFSFGNSLAWIRHPVLTTIALICWLLPIVPVLTPGTITVSPNLSPYTENLPVPQLSFDGLYWMKQGLISSDGYEAASPSIAKVLLAGAISKEVLPIAFDHAYAAYHLDFFGPALKCNTIDPEQAASIPSASDLLDTNDDASTDENALLLYTAWVPGANVSNVRYWCGYASTTTNLDLQSQDYARIYIMTKNQANATPPSGPSANLTECGLYNATYGVDFTYNNTKQIVEVTNISTTNGVSLQFLNSVDVNTQFTYLDNGNNTGSAYAALMLAMGSFLVGTIDVQNTPPVQSCTNIEYLDTSFDFTKGNPIVNGTSVEHLQRTIEEFFSNSTIGLLSNSLFWKPANETQSVPVVIATPFTEYSYNPNDLILTYSIAFAIALTCSFVGFYSFLRNGSSYQNIFSTYIRAMKDSDLVVPENDTGADPLPSELGRTVVTLASSSRASQSDAELHLIPRKPLLLNRRENNPPPTIA